MGALTNVSSTNNVVIPVSPFGALFETGPLEIVKEIFQHLKDVDAVTMFRLSKKIKDRGYTICHKQIYTNASLCIAVKKGSLETTARIISVFDATQKATLISEMYDAEKKELNGLLRLALNDDHAHILECFLTHVPFDFHQVDELLFRTACCDGREKIAQLLLKKGADPAAKENQSIFLASNNRHAKIVEMLLVDKRVDPTLPDNRVIHSVINNSRQGDVNTSATLKALVSSGKIVDSHWLQQAFFVACRDVHTEAVEILLNDPKVDPGAENNFGISKACEFGYVEIFNMLIPKINPAANLSLPFKRACENNHLEIVRVLIEDDRIEPLNYSDKVFENICLYGYSEVISLFLTHPRMKNISPSFETLRWACERKRDEICALLLKSGRMNLTLDNYRTILDIAIKNNLSKTAAEIFKVKGIGLTPQLIEWAVKNNHLEVLIVLLKDDRVTPSEFEEMERASKL